MRNFFTTIRSPRLQKMLPHSPRFALKLCAPCNLRVAPESTRSRPFRHLSPLLRKQLSIGLIVSVTAIGSPQRNRCPSVPEAYRHPARNSAFQSGSSGKHKEFGFLWQKMPKRVRYPQRTGRCPLDSASGTGSVGRNSAVHRPSML